MQIPTSDTRLLYTQEKSLGVVGVLDFFFFFLRIGFRLCKQRIVAFLRYFRLRLCPEGALLLRIACIGYTLYCSMQCCVSCSAVCTGVLGSLLVREPATSEFCWPPLSSLVAISANAHADAELRGKAAACRVTSIGLAAAVLLTLVPPKVVIRTIVFYVLVARASRRTSSATCTVS